MFRDGDTATVSWLGSGSAERWSDAWLTVILPGRMVLATYPVAPHARIIGREMYRGTRWLDSEARRLMGAFPDAIRTNRLGLNRSIGHTFPDGCVNLRRTCAPARIRNFPERGLVRHHRRFLARGVRANPECAAGNSNAHEWDLRGRSFGAGNKGVVCVLSKMEEQP